PGSAEAALQGVMRAERLMQPPPLEPLDGANLTPVGLDGKRQARADGDAVELDGARAADAVLAADVRPRQAALVPQEVGEEQPGLDLGASPDAVDADLDHSACASARVTTRAVRCLRYAGDAWRLPGGSTRAA